MAAEYQSNSQDTGIPASEQVEVRLFGSLRSFANKHGGEWLAIRVWRRDIENGEKELVGELIGHSRIRAKLTGQLSKFLDQHGIYPNCTDYITHSIHHGGVDKKRQWVKSR